MINIAATGEPYLPREIDATLTGITGVDVKLMRLINLDGTLVILPLRLKLRKNMSSRCA